MSLLEQQVTKVRIRPIELLKHVDLFVSVMSATANLDPSKWRYSSDFEEWLRIVCRSKRGLFPKSTLLSRVYSTTANRNKITTTVATGQNDDVIVSSSREKTTFNDRPVIVDPFCTCVMLRSFVAVESFTYYVWGMVKDCRKDSFRFACFSLVWKFRSFSLFLVLLLIVSFFFHTLF